MATFVKRIGAAALIGAVMAGGSSAYAAAAVSGEAAEQLAVVPVESSLEYWNDPLQMAIKTFASIGQALSMLPSALGSSGGR